MPTAAATRAANRANQASHSTGAGASTLSVGHCCRRNPGTRKGIASGRILYGSGSTNPAAAAADATGADGFGDSFTVEIAGR